MHIKKLLGLIQAAASRVSKEKYIEVLMQTMKENLEIEFEKILEGTNDLSLTLSIIIVIGNVILNSFSNSAELVGNRLFLTIRYKWPWIFTRS